MVVENTTPNRGYQLPHETNDLADDVSRLIAAIMGIDVEVAAMLVAIASKADAEHDHVIANITGLAAALAARQELAQKGEANGYASLGADGKVPSAQLPSALFGALSYQGVWNASTNSPTIPAASSGNKGYFYKVSVAGTTTVSGINDWQVGDWIVSNGATWDKVDNTDQVLSVAGLQGAIGAVALASALGLGAAPFVPLSGGTSAVDLDTVTTPGWFNGLVRGNNAGGWGDTSYGHLLVLQYSTTRTQIAFPYVASGNGDPIRFRYMATGGAWSGWQTIPTMATINAALALKASLAGATFTGPVTLAGDPASALQAATKQYVDANQGVGSGYVSAEQTLVAAGQLTLSHGLGVAPELVRLSLICKTAEHGYSVNDVLEVNPGLNNLGSLNAGLSVVVSSTSIVIRNGSYGPLNILNKSTGAAADITLTNWRLIVRAYA